MRTDHPIHRSRRERALPLVCLLLGVAVLCGVPGCSGGKPLVVLYTDQDRAVVQPLIDQFKQEKHINVDVHYAAAKDLQSGQGWTMQLREQTVPVPADLYWANDTESAMALTSDGSVELKTNQFTIQIAEPFREGSGAWIGVGARVRVLLYNKRRVTAARAPKSVACLAQATWKGRCALADPRTSVSSHTHLLALIQALGESDTNALLTAIKENGTQILPNEAAVVEAVASGKADWGVTDSDVAETAVRAGKPVAYVASDQETYSTADAMGRAHTTVPTLGTPFLPAPLLMLKSRPHPAEADALYLFLISQSTARQLQDLQPTRLPTHSTLLAERARTQSAQELNPLTLQAANFITGDYGMQHSQVTLLLTKVLSGGP